MEDEVLPPRESKFLFAAAFFRMESLEHIKFPEFRVSAQVKEAWESTRGRKLNDKSNYLTRRHVRSEELEELTREERREYEFEYLE